MGEAQSTVRGRADYRMASKRFITTDHPEYATDSDKTA